MPEGDHVFGAVGGEVALEPQLLWGAGGAAAWHASHSLSRLTTCQLLRGCCSCSSSCRRVGGGGTEIAVVAVEVVRGCAGVPQSWLPGIGRVRDLIEDAPRGGIAIREVGGRAIRIDVVADGEDVAVDALDDRCRIASRSCSCTRRCRRRRRRPGRARRCGRSTSARSWYGAVADGRVPLEVWPAPRLDQVAVSLPPDATPVCCAICAKLPLANGRPKKVTVSGSASGSETPTLSVGEMPIPVPPFAGEFSVGAAGAPLPARRDEAGHPAGRADRGAGLRVARVVGEAAAAAVVQVPDTQQPALRARDLGVLGRLDLRQRARRVPDPHLIDDTGEETGGGARRRQGAADRGKRRRGRIGRLADRERPVQAPSR